MNFYLFNEYRFVEEDDVKSERYFENFLQTKSSLLGMPLAIYIYCDRGMSKDLQDVKNILEVGAKMNLQKCKTL